MEADIGQAPAGARTRHGPWTATRAVIPGAQELIVVRTKPAARSLEAFLVGERDRPVVVLSQSPETLRPALDPAAVRQVIGSGCRIYYIPGEFLLRRLQGTLGRSLAVPRSGARIFWPGLSSRSKPEDHPLVMVLQDESETDARREFARQFDLSRPNVRREIAVIEDARALLQHQLELALEDNRQIAQQLRDTKIERHDALTRATAAEERLAGPDGALHALSCEEQLHTLIVREWISALTPADRRAQPLAPYVLAPGFVEMIERQPEIPIERLAWVCAMVACGYAPALTGLAPHPLLAAPGGPQLERAEIGKGWRCNLKRNAPSGPRLHY